MLVEKWLWNVVICSDNNQSSALALKAYGRNFYVRKLTDLWIFWYAYGFCNNLVEILPSYFMLLTYLMELLTCMITWWIIWNPWHMYRIHSNRGRPQIKAYLNLSPDFELNIKDSRNSAVLKQEFSLETAVAFGVDCIKPRINSRINSNALHHFFVLEGGRKVGILSLGILLYNQGWRWW